jgi:hypothetical protein
VIVITQPTYLPWSGYFDLLDRSETFVFLDDVQFNKRSWQQKNRIILNNDYKDLTIPVKKKGLRFQKIKDSKIADKKFIIKHLKTIQSAYSSCKFFKQYFPRLENSYKSLLNENYVSNINIFLIKLLCDVINIKTNFILSSSLKINLSGSEKLAKICMMLNKKKYLTNIGALEYLNLENEKKFFKTNDIDIYIQSFQCKKYLQQSKSFLDKASFIDMLFNEGEKSLEIIRASREKDKKLI